MRDPGGAADHRDRWVPAVPEPLVTGDQAGAADRAAVARGDSWDGLLARAGGALAAGVVERLQTRTGGVYGRRVLVVVGKGDNGGDGWVAADRLRQRGVAVTVLAADGIEVATSAHSARARAAWLGSGGRVLTDPGAYAERWPRLARHELPDVAVDCVLGTGARGAPRGAAVTAVGVLRGLRPADVGIVACDVPSGVDASTGAVADPELAVVAELTVTFGAAKRGLVTHPGRAHVGAVRVADLGPSWALDEDTPPVEQWYATGDALAAPRPWSPSDDKLARGRVVLVAGSQRYAGAAVLAAAAAVRGGAGLVTLVTSAPAATVRSHEPGVMVATLPAAADDVGGPAADAAHAVRAHVAAGDVVVVGPGLGHEPGTRGVVEAALGIGAARDGAPLRSSRSAVVLDADGCNVFRGEASALRGVEGLLVLTPHERELARLLGCELGEVVADRTAAAAALADVADALVVAKGPATVVVGPGLPTAVVTSGGPALGSGGTGDVLAGLLGAALAPVAARGGAAWPDAVHRTVAGAVHLHGLLGAVAGRRAGGRATAMDLLEVAPAVLAELAARRAAEGWRW